MKANAIVFEAEKKVVLREIDLPEMRDDELLVRNRVSGISIGTERWALLGRRHEMKYPLVTGYLGVGVIERVGSAVKAFDKGQRVLFTSARPSEPYASHSWMGTHSAVAVVPTTIADDWPPYVCRIPDGVDDTAAAMSGLLAVAVQGADMVKVTSKSVALVLGVGMIGQCSAQVLRAKGARVIVADKTASRVALAISHGADGGVTLGDGPIAPQLKAILPEAGADIVVDTTSVAAVVQQLTPLVRPRGQILLQGYYPGLTAFDLDTLHIRRPTISVACSMDIRSQEYAFRLVRDGHANVGSLCTHRYAAADAAKAYDAVLNPPPDLLGAVIDWQ